MDKGAYKFEQIHPVHNTMDGFFNTVSNRKISLYEPQIETIDIRDIAHSLAQICRFGGHTRHHYSVAQHSVLVMKLAPDHLKLHALLHDATEAYLGDVIKPLKNILGGAYSDIEKKFEKLIIERFQLHAYSMELVKPFDREALEIEHEYFFKQKSDRFFQNFGSWYFWTPQYGLKTYLQYFYYEFNRAKEVSHG